MIQQLNIEQLRSAKISIMNEEREIKRYRYAVDIICQH
jgi:hypothetical protein